MQRTRTWRALGAALATLSLACAPRRGDAPTAAASSSTPAMGASIAAPSGASPTAASGAPSGASVAATPAAPRPALVAGTHRRGVVVNHWVSSLIGKDPYGAAWFDRDDVAWIARHGFDHIRLRADARAWVRPDGTLDPAKLAPIDAALAWARSEHLGLTLAITEFPVGEYHVNTPLAFERPEVAASAAQVWRLVAERYRAAGDELRFELIHKPNAKTAAGLAAFSRSALAAVRAVDARRFVYLTVPSSRTARIGELALPADPRVGLALDFLQPEDFTPELGGASPTADSDARPLDSEAYARAFDQLARWLAAHAPGREVYIAQLGAYYTEPPEVQREHLRALRAAVERVGLAWAVYDYHTGCAVRGADGTTTVAYDGLGLGVVPPPRELAFAYIDGGKTTGAATLRIDGAQRGMNYPADAKRRRTSSLVLADDGMPARYDSRTYAGETDRWGAQIDERYRRSAGRAFYVPVHDDPLTVAAIARWLVEHPGQGLPLEPRGEATGEVVETRELDGARVSQVVIRGLDLDPVVVWLDAERLPFAMIDGPASGYIAARHAARFAELAAAQTATLARGAEALAARLVQRHDRGLVIRHARVFDPQTLAVTPERAIAIRDGLITAVGADAAIATPAGADELDARGRFVMPGLWDSHGHLFGRSRALLQLAAGVTGVREMGNEGPLPAQVARYDAGVELGPRVVMALRFGFADQPSMPRVTTEAEARAIVERAAAGGYAQLKVLDDIDGALVPLLARLAHARGLRFSGHLPRALTLEQFAAVADEVQHVPALFRGQARGARTADASVAQRIAVLARRKVVLDPTLAGYRLAPGASGLSVADAALAPRLPPLARRQLEREALAAEDQAALRADYVAYARAVRLAVDAGVVVIPGSDAQYPGAALHHELRAYVDAGLAPARVLRMATLDAARNLGRGARAGQLAPGRDADLLVIDGDPTRDLRDLDKLAVVVTAGRTIDPAAVRSLLGLRDE